MKLITAESIIHTAWDEVFRGDLIPDPYRSGLGLLFNVEINIDNHGYEQDGSTHHADWERSFYRSLLFVVTARHEVFLRTRNHPGMSTDEPHGATGLWQNTSNHDSCWRSDGLRPVWETLCEGHAHCWAHVPEPHQASMNTMHTHCHVNTGPFSRGLIHLVRVVTEADPARSGWRRLTSLQNAPFRLVLEETSENASGAASAA